MGAFELITMLKNQLMSAYRREGKWSLIDLKLKTLAQLYNTFDPSPFHERDLDDAAADYIEEAVGELHVSDSHIKLIVHLYETIDAEAVTKAREAIHNYFAYRARVCRLKLRQQFRIGRISLLVGLLFLGFCFELSVLVSSHVGAASPIMREGFLIIGWVAMWKPLEIFLYSWWPILSQIRLYEKISTIPVEFCPA